MPEPDDQGELSRKLRAGLAWFNAQSENTRIAIIVAAVLIAPIAIIFVYSFLSDHLVTILISLATLGFLSALAGMIVYWRWKKKNEAEDQRSLQENLQACPSCAEWNEKEAEFCRNCARPFKDQKLLADFLAYANSRPPSEKDLWKEKQVPAQSSPAPAAPSRAPIRTFGAERSFTWAALITMLLYLFLCWPVGAIANMMWLSEADRIYSRTGNSPSGRGCLRLLGWVFILVPVIALVAGFLVGFFGVKAQNLPDLPK